MPGASSAIARAPSRDATAVRAVAFFGKLFKPDPSEATRKKYAERVERINALEPQLQALTDEQLRDKTEEFKRRAQGGESLDALLVEAFAVRAEGGQRAAAAAATPAAWP